MEQHSYKVKLDDLQAKIRKSKLEHRELENEFQKLMSQRSDCDRSAIHSFRARYNRVLEEERRRNDRNERLKQMLERIDYQAAALAAKTERLKLLKAQYELYLMRFYGPHSGIPIYTIPSPPPTTKMEHTSANLYPKTLYIPQTERQYATVTTAAYVPSHRYVEIDPRQPVEALIRTEEYPRDHHRTFDPERFAPSNVVISPSLLLDNQTRNYSPERNLHPEVSTYSQGESPSPETAALDPSNSNEAPKIPSLTLSVPPPHSPISDQEQQHSRTLPIPFSPGITTSKPKHNNESLINTINAPSQHQNDDDGDDEDGNDNFSSFTKQKLFKTQNLDNVTPKSSIAMPEPQKVSVIEDVIDPIEPSSLVNTLTSFERIEVDDESALNSPADEQTDVLEEAVPISFNSTYAKTETKKILNQIVENAGDDRYVNNIHQVWEKVVDEDDVGNEISKSVRNVSQENGEENIVERKIITKQHNEIISDIDSTRREVLETMYQGISKLGPANKEVPPEEVEELIQHDGVQTATVAVNNNVTIPQPVPEMEQLSVDYEKPLEDSELIENVPYEEQQQQYDSNYQAYAQNSQDYQYPQEYAEDDPNYTQHAQGMEHGYDTNYQEYQTDPAAYQQGPEIYPQQYQELSPQQYEQYQNPENYQVDPQTYQQNQKQYRDPQYAQNYEAGAYQPKYDGTDEQYPQGYAPQAQENVLDGGVYQPGGQEEYYNEQLYTDQEFNEQQFPKDPNYKIPPSETVADLNQYYDQQTAPEQNYYPEETSVIDPNLPPETDEPISSVDHSPQQNISEPTKSITSEYEISLNTLPPTEIEGPSTELPSAELETRAMTETVAKPKKKRVNFLDSDSSDQSAIATAAVKPKLQDDSDFDFSATSK